MAHYAKIENGVVTQVIVAEQEYIDTIEGQWLQTSYNTLGGEHKLNGTPLRKNYAGIGYAYDEELDAFIPPKLYESWILNEETCLWEAPIAKPNDGKKYDWDEETVSWVERT